MLTRFNRLELALLQLTSGIQQPQVIRLLRKLVYAWFFCHTLILLPAHRDFWGADSLIPPVSIADSGGIPFLHLLSNPAIAGFYPLFLILYLLLLLLGMVCVYPRIISILVYILALNIDNKVYLILDGGNNLMHLILFYLIFLDPSCQPNPYRSNVLNALNNGFSNLGLLLIRLQIVMVYLVAGLAKVDGTLWQNGTALYYTLNVDEYSHPWAKYLVAHYPLFTVLGSYATVLYQVCFPWLVWNKNLRPYLLAFGTFLHLQIALVMGLFMFGMAIAISYFAFASEAFASKCLRFFARLTPGWLMKSSERVDQT